MQLKIQNSPSYQPTADFFFLFFNDHEANKGPERSAVQGNKF